MKGSLTQNSSFGYYSYCKMNPINWQNERVMGHALEQKYWFDKYTLAQGLYQGVSTNQMRDLRTPAMQQQQSEKNPNLDQATYYSSLFKQTSQKQDQTLEQWLPLKKQVIFASISSWIQKYCLRSEIMTLTALFFCIIYNCIFFKRVCSQYKESSEAEKEVNIYISTSTH